MKEDNITESKEGEIIPNLVEGRMVKNIVKWGLFKDYMMSSVRETGKEEKEIKQVPSCLAD